MTPVRLDRILPRPRHRSDVFFLERNEAPDAPRTLPRLHYSVSLLLVFGLGDSLVQTNEVREHLGWGGRPLKLWGEVPKRIIRGKEGVWRSEVSNERVAGLNEDGEADGRVGVVGGGVPAVKASGKGGQGTLIA
jgi:hypothetical protein